MKERPLLRVYSAVALPRNVMLSSVNSGVSSSWMRLPSASIRKRTRLVPAIDFATGSTRSFR